jgi:uncharacterized small protein (DUF1192 family)
MTHKEQIELRDKVIDELRQRIKLLQTELNKRKWWRIWR